MSSTSLDNLRTEVLGLTENERAELARDLLGSLDGASEVGAGEAWEREVLRRLDQVEGGTATLLSREEMRQRMRSRLAGVGSK